MGRESRQARRARERRQQQQGRGRRAQQTTTNWNIIAIVTGAVAAMAIIAIALVVFTRSTGSSSSNDPLQNIPTPLPGKTIDAIKCDPNEQITYHVHAHFEIVVGGKTLVAPAGTGININNDCLYWLHVHNPDGIIHVEAPSQITPTLGQFFDIWGQPLSPKRVWKWTISPQQPLRMYINGKVYTGNPRAIKIHAHDIIQFDIGKPFARSKGYNFGNL